MNTKRCIKHVYEGQYVAEVDVELIESDDAWAPYLSLDDARKLDEMREALRRGNLKAATHLGRVYALTPIAV